MKRVGGAWLLLTMVLLAACRTEVPVPTLAQARELILTGRAECVLLVAGTSTMAQSSGRGVSPLLRLYDAGPQMLQNGIIVDKVIGRAAAMIAINGRVAKVHGELMSAEALALLQKHGIEVSYTKLVPQILNRRRDGLCPLEQSVQGEEEPAAALVKLRKRIAELAAPPKL